MMAAAPTGTAHTFRAGTIVTSDYLPWARVVSESFARHHPAASFTVLVLDDPKPDQLREGDRFELIGPQDVGLAPAEYGWMAAIYDGFELSCALKPWLLRLLLQDAGAALYLDSDILVCSSLADIAARATDNGLVLSPHTLEPPPSDGLLPDEDTFLRLGQFNGGFLAVGPGATGFLDWWGQRLARECVHWSAENPLRFVDQRWLDLAVNYFEVDVLRDRGANVAYWNLGSRVLEHGPAGYTVDGEELKFMHFSGFEPTAPEILSKHLGEPARVDTRRSPALARICSEYATVLRNAGLDPHSHLAQPATMAGAIVLTPPVRAALRAVLQEAERSDTDSVPDPRDADGVMAWLHAPITPGGTSRYLIGLHASHDAVRREFAQVPGADEPRYQSWSDAQGVALGLVPARPAQGSVLPSAQGPLAATSALLIGLERAVDLVLEFAADAGGESLAVAVAPERIAPLAARIEAEAERRGVVLDADISLVECRDSEELTALLRRADRTIDSGCPMLERAGSEAPPVQAVAPRAPVDFLLVNTYPSNPVRQGGGMRIQSLWGSMPADIRAQAVVLSHSDGGAARMPLTRARPGFEQHVPFWPALRATIQQLKALTGTSCDDVALALAAIGDDPFSQALNAAASAGADALVLSHPFMVRQAIAAAPKLPIVYEAHNVEADLKASMFRDDEGGRTVAALVAELEAEACAHASLVVCCTEEDRHRLIELYGVAREKVHVIPNGTSFATAVFTPWEMRDLAAPRCVFAGSAHAPNLEAAAIIIEAAASLPGIGFDLVGDLAGELGSVSLPPNVVLHGRVSEAEKQRLFRHATLALNPMKVGSGSNLKVVDYLAAGLPVLSSQVGARGFSSELVDCLEVVAPDPTALAQAIERGLERDWSATTSKAREIVESEYDWRVISARYAGLLHDTLGAREPSAEAA
jgi:glycosyltransferase involved in cell wall biosynthesis